MAYSPYQTAGSQATLYDLFEQSKTDTFDSDRKSFTERRLAQIEEERYLKNKKDLDDLLRDD